MSALSRTGVPARRRWPYGLAVFVVLVGLIVTAGLTVLVHSQYRRDEDRLLELHGRELASVLTAALPSVQTPLASTAALAGATNGNPVKFKRFVSQYAGTARGREFVSASLWRLGSPAHPVASVGAAPKITSSPAMARALFVRAAHTGQLSVVGLTPPDLTRLGYAVITPQSGRYVVYAESALPANRQSRLSANAAFSELDYAIYLGSQMRPQDLLTTSLATLPLRGRQDDLRIPFGDTVLTAAVAARQPLGGNLPQELPWIIAIAGTLLSFAAGALTVRLIQRRRAAEKLATRLEEAVQENRMLYAEQRTIAQTLQHSLLPDALPKLDGAVTTARYEPGQKGAEIGGDWYDVIPLGGHEVLLVVGDVSGHGVAAAATMASLRYAIHAYAAQNDSPGDILTKLSSLRSLQTSGHFATVLCARIDVAAREVTLANAGHLPPLLLSDGQGCYIDSPVGMPIGVEPAAAYRTRSLIVPANATLLAFTDGLVERRGEPLDTGLDRLRSAAASNGVPLPELVDRVLVELRNGVAEDDTAIVGLRFTD